MEVQKKLGQTALLGSSIGKPDHSLLERERPWLAGSNFLPALLHSQCCGRRVELNVVLCDSPKSK